MERHFRNVLERVRVLVTSSRGNWGHGTHLAADSIIIWKGEGHLEWVFWGELGKRCEIRDQQAESQRVGLLF